MALKIFSTKKRKGFRLFGSPSPSEEMELLRRNERIEKFLDNIKRTSFDSNTIIKFLLGYYFDSGMTGHYLIRELKKFNLWDDRIKHFSDNKITSDEEFRDYAHNVMQQAHKDNYSEETTNKVVDDLLKNNPGADYGELVGRLTSGFGK